MTPGDLSAYAGVLISLFASYCPGFAPRWAQLEPTYQRLIMLVTMVAVSILAFGSICGGANVVAGTCDRNTATGYLTALLRAMVTNQAAYAITPKIYKRRTAVTAGAASVVTTEG